VIAIEQVLASGCDEGGAHTGSKAVEAAVRALMRDDRLTGADQARLLALFLLAAKSCDAKTCAELLASSRLEPAHKRAIANLPDVHVPLARAAADARPDAAPPLDDAALKRNKKAAADAAKKRLCRYVTKVEDAVRAALRGDGALSEEAFPWVKAPPARAGGGAGGAPLPPAAIDARSLTNAQARAAKGEVQDRFAAAVLDAPAVDLSRVKTGATKKSKFAQKADEAGAGGAGGGGAGGGGGTGAGGGGAGGAGGDAAAAADAAFARMLEPPKPRAYEGGRVIVFVVGGVTQAEVAALERLSRETNREIVVGGTSIMTARDLFEQLEKCGGDDGGGGGGGGSGGGGGGGGGQPGAGALSDDGVDLDAVLAETF